MNKKRIISYVVLLMVLTALMSMFAGCATSEKIPIPTVKENVFIYDEDNIVDDENDLIPNLVATVKGYANHEEAVFTEIADARSKLAGSIESGDMESISEANTALDSALSKLLAISENYPDLKASEQFIALQDELAGTENRIAVARQYYNEKLNTYNTKVQKFPSSIVAGMSGYYPMEYFEADEGAKEVPTVNFD